MKLKNKIYLKFGIGGNLIIISVIILVVGFIPNMVKIIERATSEDYIQTTASIISIEEEKKGHKVTVLFNTPDGKEYTSLLDTYVQGMTVGDDIEIYSKLSKPENITLKGNQFWQAVLFGSIGGGLLIVSLVLLRKHYEKKQ